MPQLRASNMIIRNATTRSTTAPGTAGPGELTVVMSRRANTRQKPATVDPYNTLGSPEAKARRAFYLNRR